MKKLWFILIIALGVAFTSCKKSLKDQIVGKWQLEAVSGEELSESEKSMVLEFKSDGTALNSKASDPAKWELVDDKTLVVKTEGGREEKFENIALEGDKMTFSAGNDKITLKKI